MGLMAPYKPNVTALICTGGLRLNSTGADGCRPIGFPQYRQKSLCSGMDLAQDGHFNGRFSWSYKIGSPQIIPLPNEAVKENRLA